MDWISAAHWTAFAGDGTDAHRVATARDGWLDRYGDWILWSGSSVPPKEVLSSELSSRYSFIPRGCLARGLVRKAADQKPAVLVGGDGPGEITVRENRLSYSVDPAGGYSSGLFLDQRLNRQWVAALGSKRMLNLFAYTCSFTVCAAAAGAVTCSVDSSKRVLGTGRENLVLNGIDPAQGHRFLADDVTKVVPRLAKRGDSFDLIVLDPPTFGRAGGRVFRIGKDLGPLLRACWSLLEPRGWILVSCNYAEWNAADLRRVACAALDGEKFTLAEGELPPEIPHGSVSWRIGKV